MKVETQARFWSKVDIGTVDNCWPWTAYRNPQTGYGQFSVSGEDRVEFGHRTITAHVVVCTLAHGPRPDGMEVLHSCDNRPCCNPTHLRWGTPAENQREAWDRGRQLSGERHHQSKYSDATVLACLTKVAEGADPKAVALAMGVPLDTVYKWRQGRIRKGVAA